MWVLLRVCGHRRMALGGAWLCSAQVAGSLCGARQSPQLAQQPWTPCGLRCSDRLSNAGRESLTLRALLIACCRAGGFTTCHHAHVSTAPMPAQQPASAVSPATATPVTTRASDARVCGGHPCSCQSWEPAVTDSRNRTDVGSGPPYTLSAPVTLPGSFRAAHKPIHTCSVSWCQVPSQQP